MSLVVLGSVLAAAAVVAAAAAIAARTRHRRLSAPALPPAVEPPFDSLELQVGDVVMRGERDIWLTGALVLSEGDGCVAAVFLASVTGPDAPAEALVVRPGPPRSVAWVRQEQPQPWPAPPDSIELDGEWLKRTCRIPVSVATHGDVPAGAGGEPAVWLQFEGASGSAAFVLFRADRCLLWRGTWQEPGSLMRLAAGKSSLRT
jgi:hypothetical protein